MALLDDDEIDPALAGEADRVRRLAMHVGWLEGTVEMAVRELRAGRHPLVLADAIEGMLNQGKEKYYVR